MGPQNGEDVRGTACHRNHRRLVCRGGAPARVYCRSRGDSSRVHAVVGYARVRTTLFGGVLGIARFPVIATAGNLLQNLGRLSTTALHYNSRACADLESEITSLLTTDGVYESGACRRDQLSILDPDPDALIRLWDRFRDSESMRERGFGRSPPRPVVKR